MLDHPTQAPQLQSLLRVPCLGIRAAASDSALCLSLHVALTSVGVDVLVAS